MAGLDQGLVGAEAAMRRRKSPQPSDVARTRRLAAEIKAPWK
jgi:hypothetical protein